MKVLLAVIALTALNGCANGPTVGVWVQFDDETPRSFAFSKRFAARDPRWRCPDAAVETNPGVPVWMTCPAKAEELTGL